MNGDLGLCYYIKDVVVRPEYQKRGIGRTLINELMKFIRENGVSGTDIFALCWIKFRFMRSLVFRQMRRRGYGFSAARNN